MPSSSFLPLLHAVLPDPFRDRSHEIIIQQEVQSFLQAGATQEVSLDLKGKGFYFHYFLIPKAKGGHRPILDLRKLYKFLKKIILHVVTLALIIPFLEQEDWYAALDLKGAYVHVTIRHNHRKFLRFLANGSHYQLLFGLSVTHQLLLKCMVVFAAHL